VGSYPRGTDRLTKEQAASLGRRLAAWRALHGVLAWRLAQDLGMPNNSLSLLERGLRVVPAELAERICNWTGLDLEGDGVRFSDTGEWGRSQCHVHAAGAARPLP
jgi:transcriptional regulator with XRE-family HTH domain